MADAIDTDELSPSNENRLEQLKSRDAKRWLSALAAAAAATSMAGALSAIISTKGDGLFRDGAAEARRNLDSEMVAQIRSLRTEVAGLKKAQEDIGRLPAPDRLAVQNTAIMSRMSLIEQRQQRLEQAISNSPEKALALPMMRRDIDNMRENNTTNLAALKQNVDQVYDLTKWLLGALAVGVFSLAIANFFTKK